MPISRLRGLLSAALCLLLAACAGEGPSAITPSEGISTATLNGVQLTLVSGGGQSGVPGQSLADPIVVRVTDRTGAPVANGVLNFIPPRDGGVDPRQTRTDAQGYARATWTLGALGPQTLRVSGVGGTLVITANGLRGSGTRIALVKTVGDGQQQPAGSLLRSGVQVKVMRDDGRPVSGAVVTWTPSAGSLDRTSGRSSAVGLTHVRWTLGPEGGTQTLTASTPGAEPVTFTATATGGAPRPATLQVLPDSLVIDAGATAALMAHIRDASGALIPGLAPVWSSSDATVATVDSIGRVRGVAGGTARITARLGALSAFATVRVRPGAASIQVVPDSLVLEIGGGGRLTAVVRDASGAILPGPTPTWSSSSPAVATVDASGNVLGVAAGTVRVTATLGPLSAYATVRVRAPAPAVTIPLIQHRVSSTGGPIDLSQRNVTLNFWVHTSRPVSSITMRVRSPLGRLVNCVNPDAENRFYNEFRCQVYLSRGWEPGLWRVDRVTVTGADGSYTFTSADLDAMGTHGRAIDVYGTGPDVLPPQVRVVWPHQGTRYPDIYWVQFGVVDHVSGVRSVQATVRGPGGVTHTCEAHSSNGALPREASWLCRLPLAMGSGTWHLVSVTTDDGAGNRVTYTPQQIDQWRGMFELTFLQYEFEP